MPNKKLREDGRPTVGPADPATRKRLLDERLKEKEPKGLYAKPSPAAQSNPTKDISIVGTVRKIKERKAKPLYPED